MNIATVCLAIACALPLLCVSIAKSAGIRDRTFDNRDPRGWLAKQTGATARANAAQQNSWEALIIFAAGVLSAQASGARTDLVDALAIAFVVLRLIYIGLYIANKDSLRSLVWFLGLFASLALFFVDLM